jgi:hypothetical protein
MDDLRMTSDDRRHQVVTVLLDILKSFSMQCEVSGNLIIGVHSCFTPLNSEVFAEHADTGCRTLCVGCIGSYTF